MERTYPLAAELHPLSCVHTVFSRILKQFADKTAVQCGSTHITYGELDCLASRIQFAISGSARDARSRFVGLYLERSVHLVAAELGVLKAGCAYVPLDTELPRQPLQHIIRDAGLGLIITCSAQEQRLRTLIEPLAVTIVLCDSELPIQLPATAGSGASPDDAAYLMYTSGSTGKSKGVIIPHRGITRLAKDPVYIEISEESRFLLLAPPAFDASTFEVWTPLLNGATLIVMPPGPFGVREILEVVERERVSVLWLSVGLFNLIVDEGPARLGGVDQLLIGGDALSVPHVMKAMEALPSTSLINGYGPTESTTFAICHRIQASDLIRSSIPIGTPISYTEAYILDDNLDPVSTGEAGMLYLSGQGLALGYLNQPELTARQFMHLKPPDGVEKRVYRTGDICRQLPSGVYEFVGREDEQVKIRGYRVETQEINCAVLEHPDVLQSVVLAPKSQAGLRQLECYVVLRAPDACGAEDLQKYLKQKLPSYMQPHRVAILKALPLSSNGKIDRLALTSLAASGEQTFDSSRNAEMGMEGRLQKIWSRALGRRLGVDDSFFESGGDSLSAMQCVDAMEREFQIECSLEALFQAPTIIQFAQVLERTTRARSWRHAVCIRSAGQGSPLFFVHGGGGGVVHFRDLAERLGSEQMFYAFGAQNLNWGATAQISIETIASTYLSELKQIQPNGPYRLGGLCFGGNIAYEMALQLASEGQRIAFLGLFDTPYFGDSPRAVDVYIVQYKLRRLLLGGSSRRPAGRGGVSLEMLRTFATQTMSRILNQAPPLLSDVEQRIVRAVKAYRPEPYSGSVTCFVGGTDKAPRSDRRLLWNKVAAGGVQYIPLPGVRSGMVQRPDVDATALALRRCLVNSV